VAKPASRRVRASRRESHAATRPRQSAVWPACRSRRPSSVRRCHPRVSVGSWSSADVVHLDLPQGDFATAQFTAQFAVTVAAQCPRAAHELQQFGVGRACAQAARGGRGRAWRRDTCRARLPRTTARGCSRRRRARSPTTRSRSRRRRRRRCSATPLRRGSDRARQSPASATALRRRSSLDGTTCAGSQALRVADIHVFDQSHRDAGAAEALEQVEHGMVVAPRCTTVLTLTGAGPRLECGVDAIEHLRQARRSRRSSANTASSSVETDRDAMQAVALELGGMLREQHAVGRQREVVDAVDADSSATRSGKPLRNNGSPPVRRSLRTPSALRRAPAA
jgi:hypothetical protein